MPDETAHQFGRGQMIKYPLKFRAAILERNHQPLSVDEVDFWGPLHPGQVLVRIHYSGICGKQLEEIKGSAGPDPYLPHMLGHEGSGIVVDVGPGVKKVVPGNRVVLHWLKGSGIDPDTPSYSRGGQRLNAGWVTTFNEYGVVAENRVTPVPDDADSKVACLLGCVVTTGVGVILNEANVRPGESVAVFGCGGVGLNAIQGAKLVQAQPIIAVDRSPRSLEMAAAFGASHAILSSEKDVLGELRAVTGGKGAGTVVVATGDPNVIELAIEASSTPGSVFLTGVPPLGSRISVDALSIHRRRTITGSYGGGTWPDRDIPAYWRLFCEGKLRLHELISEVVSLERINEGIALLREGVGGRCVVEMTDEWAGAKS